MAAFFVPLAVLAGVSLAALVESTHTALLPQESAEAPTSAAEADMTRTESAPVLSVISWVLDAPARTVASLTDLDADRDIASFSRLITTGDSQLEESFLRNSGRRIVRVGKGDTLMNLLVSNDVPRDDALASVEALKSVFDPRRLWAGQEVVLLFDALSAEPPSFEGIALERSYDREIVVSRTEDGFEAAEVRKELTEEPMVGSAVIETSLFEAGADAGIPASVLVEMIRAFSFDVDFQREIRTGDRFEVLYHQIRDETGEIVYAGEVAYAKLTLGDEDIPIYQFTPDSGFSDFFHTNGQSVRRALLRTPIDGARISSGFGKRRHPILGYTRMHRGTDFAAASGTPVYAAGDATVEMAQWNGGYGKYVRLRHNDTYKTAYAHLKSFASGVKSGARVRQGQIIGYVGSTGRSTGPHLHYEVHVNGQQVNPLGVKLPAGEKLKGDELQAFEIAITEIDRQFANLAGDTRLAENPHE